jgi:RimJ/RimL family protein N-acetyltransferase
VTTEGYLPALENGGGYTSNKGGYQARSNSKRTGTFPRLQPRVRPRLALSGLAGWRNETSFQGPALVVVEAGQTDLIGQVGLGDRGDGIVELVYGIAPDYRGRGSPRAPLVSSLHGS